MPLRPGIDRSSTSTSKSSSRTTLHHLGAVGGLARPPRSRAASPTMRLRPSRTMAWSSASTMRIMPRPPRHRDARLDARAGAGRAVDAAPRRAAAARARAGPPGPATAACAGRPVRKPTPSSCTRSTSASPARCSSHADLAWPARAWPRWPATPARCGTRRSRRARRSSSVSSTSSSHGTPVRCVKFCTSHSMAGTSPRSSSTSGRRSAAMRRVDATAGIEHAPASASILACAAASVARQVVAQPDRVHLQRGERLRQLVVQFARDARLLLLAHAGRLGGEAPPAPRCARTRSVTSRRITV